MTNLGCTKYAIRCVYQLVKEAHCAFFYSYVHGRVSYRHYIEVTQGGIFISYGTEYEIWSVCGPVGHTEYRGTDYEQLHHVFRGKKVISIFLKKYCSIRTKKLPKVMVRKQNKILYVVLIDFKELKYSQLIVYCFI